MIIYKYIIYHDKYITTSEFNTLSCTIFDGRLKQANLALNQILVMFHNMLKNRKIANA